MKEKKIVSEPIFLVGAERSGTTVLRLMLIHREHPVLDKALPQVTQLQGFQPHSKSQPAKLGCSRFTILRLLGVMNLSIPYDRVPDPMVMAGPSLMTIINGWKLIVSFKLLVLQLTAV